MDFKKRITEELKLSKFQAEILFDEYITVCEKLAKEYHQEQLRIGGVSKSALNDEWNAGYNRGCEDTHAAYKDQM